MLWTFEGVMLPCFFIFLVSKLQFANHCDEYLFWFYLEVFLVSSFLLGAQSPGERRKQTAITASA
jgi:hypothetical protein